ncbi:hypothetical protein BJ170DRAFT_285141 [Xylariales sp. AK1849]|nr:hypothetical protein BJ170DRAFT_285141 [Xylariales sp. AK1849]
MLENLHWPDSRKRAREIDDNGTLGFTEHRNKRLHSLPFRSSPTQKRWSGPPSFSVSQMPPSTITPADSDSEDVQQPVSHFSPWSSSPSLPQYQQQSSNTTMDVDRDTDMMATEGIDHLQPGPSQPDPIAPSITGRMPTPIHATFAAQVRGNNWGVANQAMLGVNQNMGALPSSSIHTGNGFAQPQAFQPAQDPSVPRCLDGGAEWSMVQNRRLPSPISESGGEETSVSPGMVLDTSSPTLMQRPYLPHMPHSTNPGMALHPNVEVVSRSPADADMGMMDADPSLPQEAHSPTSAPATPSPRAKFGHSRSKHTLNSWTLQPGMKKSFSIGYRADCEKCRLKIPGHFNHIIVS